MDDDSLHYIVKTLQNYRLLSNETDAVASAFQVIRGKAYKGEEGQYFTPQSVVKVAVAAVNPQPEDRVIDPACGSGSFLAAVQEEVRKKLEGIHAANAGEAALALRDWSSRNLYAIDKDSVSVRLSKAYLSMLGDGSTHVFKADSIRASGWTQSLSSVVQDGSFDIVVTNPPFGTKLKVSAQIGQEEAYELSREWRRNSTGRWEPTDKYVERDLGLIFLERSIRFLNAGGRLAIVLPDTYLFSDSYGWLVQWLSQFTITHSINVPIEAFEPHCRAKTSIIVLVKAPPRDNHMILGSVPQTFGEDKHGHPRFAFDEEGRQTTDLDDEMGDAAKGFWADHPDRDESRLFFHFSQSEAVSEGILVASYWWRKPYISAVEKFARENDCELASVGDLVDRGELKVMDGHGSPSSHVHGRGEIPYVKVVDIKNWRVIENPKYAIPSDVASKLRRGKTLQPFDLVTPTRASKNIGLFGVIMPWQTHVILTREIAVWRVASRTALLSPWLLLALMSLKVVHDQFTPLITMQMNREDLGTRYRKVLLPIPRRADARERWAGPVRSYIESIVNSRSSYEALTAQLDPSLFADRP